MRTDQLYAVVLAAGSGSRFGSAKQLEKFDGQPLVTRAVRLAEALCKDRTLLVTGNEWQAVAAAAAPLQGFLVVNPDYESGLSTSVRAGISAIRDVAAAALILLADQPLITLDHLAALESAWRNDPDRIIASAYRGTSGPPAIFPATCYDALLQLEGDRGAKAIIQANGNRVGFIEFEPAGFDVDRPVDLDPG